MKALILLAVLIAPSLPLRVADRPNILYIMADDHAAEAIGAYGGRLAALNLTPTIDRLALEGAMLTNCFCNNSICTPSRATILTGQYSHVNGIRTLIGSLPEARQSLPTLMKAAGYETAMVASGTSKRSLPRLITTRSIRGSGRISTRSTSSAGRIRLPIRARRSGACL